jgi:protein gp37
MNRTSIDWPSLAYSWNPIVGCANGCKYCYARKISNRFKMIPQWDHPEFFESRLRDPGKVGRPSTIFVGSMCDIFSEGVGPEWIRKVIDVTVECPQHTFMFLTKKPEDYMLYDFPKNCMLGTTVESIGSIHRMAELRRVPNRTFLSIEPLLGSFSDFPISNFLDLVIIGADSTPGATVPPREWIDSINHHNVWYKRNILKHYPDLHNS